MPPTEPHYTVGQLTTELGVTARALRFYEDKGLLSPRRDGPARIYTHRDRARLILVLRGKRLGFTLRGIRDFLDLYDADAAHVEQNRLLLCGVRARIATLETQRAALEQTLDELRAIEAQAMAALDRHAGRHTG